jgi:hypothetical protein
LLNTELRVLKRTINLQVDIGYVQTTTNVEQTDVQTTTNVEQTDVQTTTNVEQAISVPACILAPVEEVWGNCQTKSPGISMDRLG